MKISKYLSNCFILLIPVFLWNLIFVSYLPKAYGPEIFNEGIPNWIQYVENLLRVFIFTLPAIMIFSLKTKQQRTGFVIYLFGLIIYFLSWVVLIKFPISNWSLSSIGFSAPAFSTILFLTGIGLIGNKSFIKNAKFSNIYLGLSILFVIVHTTHAYLVFQFNYS